MTLTAYVLAFLVGSLASARIVRMIFHDSFPPMEWVRSKWDAWTDYGFDPVEGESRAATIKRQWGKLLHCPYCLAPYVTLPIFAWGVLTDFQVAWWVICSFIAASYVAAIIPASDWG